MGSVWPLTITASSQWESTSPGQFIPETLATAPAVLFSAVLSYTHSLCLSLALRADIAQTLVSPMAAVGLID
jgi:hypothetical protein